jgi:2-hydroxy-6-oxonona-2,4-dienedioate hydrolase
VGEGFWLELLGHPYSQRFYDAGGIRTRVLEAGSRDSPPLVFLHGVNGHAETYIRNLAEHGEHFWVLAMDFVGHGFSDRPLDRSYEIETYVQHVLDFMQAAGIQRASFSGESLGAWVATRLASQFPDRVDRLVLNTPGGMNANPKAMEALHRLTLDAVTEPTAEKVRGRLEWLFKTPESVTEDLVDTRLRIYSQPGYRDVTLLTLCLQDMEIRVRNMITAEELRALSTPTLLIWTTADPVAGLDVGHWCHENIRGSTLVVMDNSGHWPQYEEAERFNRVHIKFLLGQDIDSEAAENGVSSPHGDV